MWELILLENSFSFTYVKLTLIYIETLFTIKIHNTQFYHKTLIPYKILGIYYIVMSGAH
ncbi:hypothetical protein LEP1GSC041_4357 [Leptospira noguchii str. 2006001870]|nr:hypothetical protein LEP1GSC041_4357 [Leptospira noguchii str. 2006001870]